MRERTSERARDRWHEILPALGVKQSALNGKHQACPVCGGKDRFRYTNRNGEGCFVCNQCGGGDGIRLVMLLHGCNFKAAVDLIDPLIGTAQPQRRQPVRTDASKRHAMNELWMGGKAIRPDHPVGRFLTVRTGITEYPDCLRAVDRLRYPGDEPRFFPAMIAMMATAGGQPAILHRTYLDERGNKAPVEQPRRFMPGAVPEGAAVRLVRLSDVVDVLGIAEGIEAALAASVLYRLPVWSALNAGFLEAWCPPETIRSVLVFGDHDRNFRGQKAAYALAHRLSRKLQVEVHIPVEPGTDWNDVLRNQMGVAA